MKQPLVSIIIPAYNAEKYIPKCLGELRKQTYDNYEVIIIDDGSEDNTPHICEKISRQNGHVKFFKAEHGGVSKARNLGMEKASGELITFLDADDYPEPELIEEYVKAYNKWENNVSLVLCGMCWDDLYARVSLEEKHILESVRGYEVGQYYLLQNHEISMLSWNQLFNFITNKCYRKSIIESYHIMFKEDVSIAEDMLFNLDYLEHTDGGLGFINKPLYHYVKHGADSLSALYYEGAIEHVCNSFERLLDYETRQPGVSVDDVYVIKSIYLQDWVSRLTMLMETASSRKDMKEKYRFCNEQMKSYRFQSLLKDAHRGRKITGFRYITLKCKNFQCFCMLRKIYHAIKKTA